MKNVDEIKNAECGTDGTLQFSTDVIAQLILAHYKTW